MDCDESHRQAMSEISKKITATADAGDAEAYYEAVFEYAAVGLSAADNPILTQIIMDLLPAVRRIHFVALKYHQQDLHENARIFQVLTDSILTRDPDAGEAIMRTYIESQKAMALKATADLNIFE